MIIGVTESSSDPKIAVMIALIMVISKPEAAVPTVYFDTIF